MAEGADEQWRPLSIVSAATDVHHYSSHLTCVSLALLLENLLHSLTQHDATLCLACTDLLVHTQLILKSKCVSR